MALRRGRGRRTGQTGTHFHVDFHEARHTTVAIGDNVSISAPQGSRLIRTVGSEVVPDPTLRPVPVVQRPERAEPFVGRTSEVDSARRAAPGAPFQVHGPDGVGKSALLKHLAFALPEGEEGVVHAKVRRRGVYDVQAQLFKAFWECEVRFTPAPEEMPDFLGERRALVVLDDVGLDRSDLEELVETAPGCTFVVGSEEQTLWSGTAERLAGLDADAALELIELRLERPLDAAERAPATAVARALDGHPQRLVEAVAGVRAGRTSFGALAGGPAWEAVGAALSPEALSQAQQRILAVLRAADAPLGTERIAEFAGVPDAARDLSVLERDGWVRSASPRYRLAHEAGAAPKPSQEDLVRRLGDWAALRATPEEVADEAEAIERLLEGEADPQAKVALARSAEGKLALAGMMDSWERVLSAGLRASRGVDDEAYLLHQLGTRDGLIGRDGPAIEYLERALELREGLGDTEGAEVTRHNLEQIRGGGGDGFDRDGGGNGGGPQWPKVSPLVAAVAALVVGAGIYAVASGDRADEFVQPEPPKEPRTGPPAIRVEEPTRGARYSEGEEVLAAYACTAARDAQLKSCRGPVASGSPIDTTAGPHVFRVTATDSRGRRKNVEVQYSVSDSTATTAEKDETKPTIELRAPNTREVYDENSSVAADFECKDNPGGSGIRSCKAPVGDGKPIDTSRGAHEFRVVAVDRAGNTRTAEVRYRVRTAPPTDTTGPMINITVPGEGATYTRFGDVPADYSCSDPSGVASCDGPVPDGKPIDTATTGRKLFLVRAKDRAGNESQRRADYSVEEQIIK